MKCLLYCLFLETAQRPPLLRGVNDRPVSVISANGLCAAISMASEADLTPTLERIKAYEAVVEAIFAERAVVPMRYGSVLPSRNDVLRFLRDERETDTTRLRALTGCVEMGLRLIGPLPTARARATARRARRMPRASTPGRAYLQSREKRYEGESDPNADIGAIVEQYRRHFEDLTVEFKAEPAMPVKLVLGVSRGRLQLTAPKANEDRSLALYFLVRRESVPAFRERVRQIHEEKTRLQMSGPWPPYNFVSATSEQSMSTAREAQPR